MKNNLMSLANTKTFGDQKEKKEDNPKVREETPRMKEEAFEGKSRKSVEDQGYTEKTEEELLKELNKESIPKTRKDRINPIVRENGDTDSVNLLYSNYERSIPFDEIEPQFDLNDENVYFPLRAMKGQKKESKSKTLYLTIEELEYAETVANRHRMSFSTLIRTLIANSK